jgi:hypothetical protein
MVLQFKSHRPTTKTHQNSPKHGICPQRNNTDKFLVLHGQIDILINTLIYTFRAQEIVIKVVRLLSMGVILVLAQFMLSGFLFVTFFSFAMT